MSKLYLKRFKTWDNYQEANIPDGTFFVIVDAGQLGVRKGEVDILTPPNTLHDYKLPEGELVITQNDTISQAIGKLEKHIIDLGDDVQKAKDDAKTAVDALGFLEENSGITDWEKAITQEINLLKNRHCVMSESEFENLPGINPNYIYYIYEDDQQ